MHGIVFAALRDFVATDLGQTESDELFAERPPYLMSEAYGDDEFLELLERARALSGRPSDDFLRSFGSFTAERTFARLWPEFFDVAGDTRTFLLTIETRIHELVRATVPKASPPRLRVTPSGATDVRIVYDSPRRLCALLEGLVQGTAEHFGERVEIVEEACMRRGAPACLFSATLRPGPESAVSGRRR